jgi:hypothetical protein
MKRLPQCFFAFFILIALFSSAAEIYVAPNGSDTNPGTKDKPLATLTTALRKARELRRLNDPSISNGIHIILKGGTYQLYEPIFIRPEDAGTSSSPTYIEAAPGEQPVFSGGVNIIGWKKTTIAVAGLPSAAKGKVWVADVPMIGGKLFEFRQLWINNKKAVRAKDMNGENMNRILSWNKTGETCWILTPKTSSLQNAAGMEMFIHQWWAIAILRIKSFEVHGDSTKLSFHQPESKIQSEHPWPAPWISKETGNSAFYLTNAIQFLDEPGEWYLDIANRKLYYWPHDNEDIGTAIVIAPSLETLIRIEGTIDNPVSHVFLKNISFQHTGWLRPSQKGHVALQAGMYLLDAYKLQTPGTLDKSSLENQAWIGRQTAAVEVSFANNIKFEACRFGHLAATGLDLKKGTHHDAIVGCLFHDIGGTGIQAGVFSDEAYETHLPYNPSDEREVCSYDYIANNLITNVTNEDWGCVGISAGYVRNINIEHNEVSEVSYSGICVGWGWTKTINAMRNNRIYANKVHHYAKHMYDVGGMYTLSAMPGTMIYENYIDSIYKAPYAHDPKHWFYYYLDEGSSYITIKNNWSPSEKVMRNANGPGNTWENNGPKVADSVKTNAGLQQQYQYLLKEVPVIKSNRSIN